MAADEALRACLKVVRVFERLGVAYALGGSLASWNASAGRGVQPALD